jgi:hypothetical protein
VLTVELLPAGYGDAVLVTYGAAGAEPHRILIDGGQAQSFDAVAQRLRSFKGPIDLFVVTHVDTDHVGGAVRLLASKALPARIRGIWFNGFVHLNAARGMLGPIHGEKLTALIVKSGLPWNEGWPWPDGVPEGVPAGIGGPVVVGDQLPVMALPGGATATLLSPTPQKLVDLLPVWEEVVEKAGLRPDVKATEEDEVPVVAPGLLGGVSLEDLAALDTDDDGAEANGSSIAFVFEFEGVRVLFGADAHSDALGAGLTAMAGPDRGKVRLDACKLPHHGSKGNCTRAVVDLIDCPVWMISTNGRRFHHPDDEALARVVHGRDHPQLVWNYRSDRFAAFTKEYPPAESGYSVVVPDEGAEGITVRLAD